MNRNGIITDFPNSNFGVPYRQFGRFCSMGLGEVLWLVTSKASTNNYYQKLYEASISDDHIFTDLASAYAAMTANTGDTLFVTPGEYVSTASLTWAKSQTRIIGLGGPNQIYQPSTLTTGGVRFTNNTAGVSEIINFTGDYIQMYGIGTQNTVSSATAYCDIRISGRNFLGEALSLRGGQGTNQLNTVGAGVPLIVDTSVAGAGNGMLIADSTIGSSGNTARTYGPGCVQFIGGAAAGFGMHFLSCTFSTRIETATTNSVGLIQLLANAAVDRELYFNDCLFYNFVVNLGTGPTYVFRDACGTTHQIILKNCAANKGFTAWTDATTYLSNSCALGGAAYGIGLNS